MGMTHSQMDMWIRYYESPNLCKQCYSLLLKPTNKTTYGDLKRKVFCNQSCAALYNNPKRKKPRRTKEQLLEELFQKRRSIPKNKVARQSISRDARAVLSRSKRPRACHVCEYSKHVQVSHKKAVASFPEKATLGEINHESNLVFLCPNCHWEFDHDLLALD